MFFSHKFQNFSVLRSGGNNMNNYELIKFQDDDFELDVNVSPEEDTVWLTKDEISLLFDRDRTVISRHIRNIFQENELDKNRVCAKNAQVQIEGSRQIKRIVEFYNLDVIISIGYRVKSKRGIIFRRWATNVLKQYLIKGYALDSSRVLISKENYIQLENDVSKLKEDVQDIKEKMFIEPVKERLFYDGDFYDAYEFIDSLIKQAIRKVIIIDPYFDINGLSFLKKTSNIERIIYVSSKAKIFEEDIKTFKEQYGDISIIRNDQFHDRFIILDDETCYSVGTSLNSLGKRVFAIFRHSEDITKMLLLKLTS